MYLGLQIAGKTTTCLGRHFGGRDHSTIIHGRRRIESDLRARPRATTAILSELCGLIEASRAPRQAPAISGFLSAPSQQGEI
jgi:hypothetical protein